MHQVSDLYFYTRPSKKILLNMAAIECNMSLTSKAACFQKNSAEAKILANTEITGDQCMIVYYQLLLQQKEIEIFRSTIAKMACTLRNYTKDYIYNYISPVFLMLGKLFLLGSNVYIVAYTRKYLYAVAYTRKNLTTCRKSANKLSTSCVRTTCYKLSTSLHGTSC